MVEKQDIRTNPNLVEALGYYIKNRRLQKNIGLREMAEILNISPAYLSNLESGKHSMTNPLLLKKISKVLNIDHLKLFKIIGYTDKDMSDLKTEIMNEIIEEFSNIQIGEIVKDLMEMEEGKIYLVKQYIELLNK
ncbi:MAG: helix-turn-helix transcriptional regulator [Leptotrichiaceae bacterium]|nr:helix-turn-helix transcriptional regulator [Leptotrichiaceae bacterium]MBP6280611.1 helix-turn-helix transcriptional regulator [Leptotrichiaceae bacterium]MBP7100122.1 helix-turn-helix transcriptional regulator [Leptotrichiaceae bacterium]MBP7725110.1 helix-turn-helix transcriptional regulator [Leptotrichiaceae bacterium]MBP9629207.1 helix-turn-helix transcriptional regulator [Leptotrichiaceae bacterium]